MTTVRVIRPNRYRPEREPFYSVAITLAVVRQQTVWIILGVIVALCTALAGGAAQASPQAEPVKLTFATYVWQPTTVAATKSIVESFNRSHPGIQVTILPVDVNSVHDKLLTSFVGGTAADVIHDEAADIAGFTQQGYLANLTPLIPKPLKASIPKAIWDTVNYSGRITGVPSLMQTYNVFANMTNAFNHVHLGTPSGVMTSPNFRRITSAFDPREIEVGIRFQF